MNTVKRDDRSKIIARTIPLVKLSPTGDVLDLETTCSVVATHLNISRERAFRAITAAARYLHRLDGIQLKVMDGEKAAGDAMDVLNQTGPWVTMTRASIITGVAYATIVTATHQKRLPCIEVDSQRFVRASDVMLRLISKPSRRKKLG